MAWIESDCDLEDHPKFHDLMERLGTSRAATSGHLHMLWHFTMKFAWRDADLQRFGDVAIARACGWEGDAKLFIKSMQASKWMDGYVVHDWTERAGRLISDRLYNERRRKTAQDGVLRRTTPQNDEHMEPPNPTVPYRNVLTTQQQHGAFEEIWAKYPNKDGKRHACRHFLATVKTEAHLAAIGKALTNYLSSDKVKRGFIKNGSTWFNQWQDFENFNGVSQPPRAPRFVVQIVERQTQRICEKEAFSGTQDACQKYVATKRDSLDEKFHLRVVPDGREKNPPSAAA